MKKLLFIPAILSLIFIIACKKDDPDLKFNDLTIVSSTKQVPFYQKDHWAFTDCGIGISIQDCTDPENLGPCESCSIYFPNLEDVFIYSETGDTVFMYTPGSSYAETTCYLLDISDPKNVKYLANIVVSTGDYPFAFKGDYLYQNETDSGFIIYKLGETDSLNPYHLKTYEFVSATDLNIRFTMTGAFYKNYIYVGGNASNIYAIDISDPYHPKVEGQALVQYNIAMHIYNNYLYALGNHEFTIFDLTEPDHPEPVKRYDWENREDAMAFHNGYLYIAYDALEIYDVSNPRKLELVKRIRPDEKEFIRFYFYDQYIYAFTRELRPSFAQNFTILFSGNYE